MSLPYPILLILFAPFLVSLLLLIKSQKSKKQLKTKLENSTKYNLYKENLIRELQNCIEYGKDLECVTNTLSKNLDSAFPYSTLSSVFVNGQKLVFNSRAKESVSPAFIQHIKDTMLELFSDPEDKNKPSTSLVLGKELSESTTGLPVDELDSGTIMSTFHIKISIKNRVVAVISLASKKPGLYTGEDIKSLNYVSEVISGVLTKVYSQLDIEKSKTLSMIDSFSEGIFMIDRNQNLVAMNDSAANFLNIHKKIPTIFDIYSALPNTYNFKDKIDKVISENKQIIEEDVPLHTKSLKITMTPALEINNPTNVIGASILLHDSTLEKSLEQMKTDFTNIMVHELRSPLTAIKASSEFLESRADLTPQEKQQLTQMISESSKKMLDKIALILDSAKMDAGLFTIRKTPSDLKKLIQDRIKTFAPVAQEKQINLKTEIDPSISNFSFDPIRIDEVINNLLSNSLKFTPESGSISLIARQDGQTVKVSVSDTGAGIPKDKQDKLFSKYVQAPTGGDHQGTGLGLYVVKGVVEAHGGKIALESVEGHGTTITFSLPSGFASTSPSVLPATPSSPNPMSN